MDSDEQIIGPTIGDCDLTISADRTTITEGDNVQFTISHVGDCPSSPVVNIYVNDSIVYSGQLSNKSLLYVHIFNEPGEFIVYANTDELVHPSESIKITVEEDIIESFTSEVSWEINNKNVQSIEINNKEVKSIIEKDTGVILFQKSNDIPDLPVITLTFTGSSFQSYSHSSTPFVYTGQVFVDWGDNSGIIEYTGGKLTHDYEVSDNYVIKIYGNITKITNSLLTNNPNVTSVVIPNSVTTIDMGCFAGTTNLTSINIPNSVTTFGNLCFNRCGIASINIPDSITSIGAYSFYDCPNLISINLNWTSSTDILAYNSNWLLMISSDTINPNLKFIIPAGTTSLYIDKGYPSDRLMEIGNISLSSDKNILSYYDNDTATLSATVTSPSNEPVSGVTVEFFNGLTSMGTAITDSNGIATKTYDSTGAGDISFVVQVGMVDSSEYDIEDCWQVIPVGNRTGFNSNLAPTPLIITGTTKKDGNWGGTRFYGKDNGTTAINYVYLSQNSKNSSENEKIRYNLSTTTETFKIIINDGTVELYINDVLRNSVNCNTTYPLQISGGSSANPVNITNIKVKAYQSKKSSIEKPTDELSGSELDP